MEKLLREPILLIKTSWGGRSLHTDFRPPSVRPYVWSDYGIGFAHSLVHFLLRGNEPDYGRTPDHQSCQ